MRCDLELRWQDAEPGRLTGRNVVVIDVLRATTTVAEALAGGAAAVWPVAEVEDAYTLAGRLRQAGERVVLAGERDNRPPQGFDLGNSPLDFTPEAVGGAQVVLCTTNGTRALAVAAGARPRAVYTAALVNAPQVVTELAGQQDGDVTILCAGTRGRPSLEDFLCGGLIAAGLQERIPHLVLADAAHAALLAYRSACADWPTALLTADHAQALTRGGFRADVRHCSRIGARPVVVVLDGDRLRTRKPGSGHLPAGEGERGLPTTPPR